MTAFYSGNVLNSLHNESDVEQKFLYQMITDTSPLGLGVNPKSIHTKKSIRSLSIDKGSSQKNYYPDYVIIVNQLPILVIEAKAPSIELNEGYREARMYSHQLNSLYLKDINPCLHVLCTNGKELWYGSYDAIEPEIKISINSDNGFHLSSEYECLIKKVNFAILCKESEKIIEKLEGKPKYLKPSYQLGLNNSRRAQISDNSFGNSIALVYQGQFNPETREEREDVAKNAYVESKRREKHINNIEKIITQGDERHTGGRSLASENKDIIISALKDVNYKNQIFLLIGSVGSGKSTFADYLRYTRFDKNENLFWINVNLNNCPPAENEIYDWLVEEITTVIENAYSERNFDSKDFIEKVFFSEISKFKTGPISLLDEESEIYKVRYVDELGRLNADKNKKLKAIIRYFFSQKNITPVLVLDNCDKRNKERQLLMFEIANWLKKEFVCNILLPIRDTTYDIFKNEPPLDTVIKDLVFRIDPPLLQKVIEKRLKYISFNNRKNYRSLSYVVGNGATVNVKKEEIDIYLKSIVNSIFQDKFFRSIILGLAGKNIRRGIEVILDFCKSGYLKEDLILKMRAKKEVEVIPSYLVSKILLKGDRLYYSDSHSKVKNLFHSNVEDKIPDPFARLAILLYLKDRYNIAGSSGVRGYHQVNEILNNLILLGHERNNLIKEMEGLLVNFCITSESSLSNINENDYITISSSGFVHIDMLKNINYLSAISEDTFYRDVQVTSSIASNMIGDSIYATNDHVKNLNNSKILLNYLLDVKKNNFVKNVDVYSDFDLVKNKIEECSDYVNKKIMSTTTYDEIDTISSKYKSGSIELATVTGIQPHCLFVEFDVFTGYISRKKCLEFNSYIDDVMENGDLITVEIVGYNKTHRKFDVVIDSI